MVSLYFEPVTILFDKILAFWEDSKTQRVLALGIFCVYLAALVGIELNRDGFLPPEIAVFVPHSHFQAIHIAFSLILVFEVVSLILTLANSLSRSLGKQFEIMALILLRNAFKELSNLPEPVSLASGPEPVFRIAMAGVAALGIFICLGVYNKLRAHQRYIHEESLLKRYIISKKMIAFVLLILAIVIGIRDLGLVLYEGKDTRFFETVYTILIFADIALVLVSQRFMPTFHAVFRNSGFVIGTIMMRLSLSAPYPWDVATSLFAAVYIVVLTWATGYFKPELSRTR